MYLRKSSNRRQDASIDEPLNTDTDGNELLLMDVLTSDDPQVGEELERSAERAALRGRWGGCRPGSAASWSCASASTMGRSIPRRRSPTRWASPRAIFPGSKSASSAACVGSWRQWDKICSPGGTASGPKCWHTAFYLGPRPAVAARQEPPESPRGRTCAASTGQCLLHHRLRPGIRHKLHGQPGDHVHLGLQRVQQVLVPLPRPRRCR